MLDPDKRWVSKHGNRGHITPNCGAFADNSEVEEVDAEETDRRDCNRCQNTKLAEVLEL